MCSSDLRLSQRMQAEVGAVDISRLGHKLVVALKDADPVSERARLLAWIPTLVVERNGKALFRVEEGPDGSVGLAVMEEGLSPENLDTDRVGADPLSAYFGKGEAFSGDHHDRGIWVSAGPGLSSGKLDSELKLLDVAPTLLAMMGQPKAQDMQGRVATEL